MRKRLIPIFFISLTICTSCSLTSQEPSTPPDGWYEVNVPLGNQENSYTINDLYFLNRDVGWIVGRKTAKVGTQAYLGFTGNGGKNWSFTTIENATDMRSVHFFDRREGVLANIVLYHTSNGGESYQRRKIREGEPAGGIYTVAFGTTGTGWGVGPFGAVTKSSDGGQTWRYLDLGYNDTWFKSVDAIGNLKAWVLADEFVLHTTDGGDSWQKKNLAEAVEASSGRYNAITFTDSMQGWVVGDFRRILHTTDGGQTWTLQYPKNENQRSFDGFTAISASDSLHALSVTGHGAILHTTDGGHTWTEQLPAKDEGGSFHSVQMVDSFVAYAVGIGPGGAGRLMKTVTGGKIKTKENSE